MVEKFEKRWDVRAKLNTALVKKKGNVKAFFGCIKYMSYLLRWMVTEVLKSGTLVLKCDAKRLE